MSTIYELKTAWDLGGNPGLDTDDSYGPRIVGSGGYAGITYDGDRAVFNESGKIRIFNLVAGEWQFYGIIEVGYNGYQTLITQDYVFYMDNFGREVEVYEDQLDGTYNLLDTVDYGAVTDNTDTSFSSMSISSDGSVLVISVLDRISAASGLASVGKVLVFRESGGSWQLEKQITSFDQDPIVPMSLFGTNSRVTPNGERIFVTYNNIPANTNPDRYPVVVYQYNGVDDWDILADLPTSPYDNLIVNDNPSDVSRFSSELALYLGAQGQFNEWDAFSVSGDGSVVCLSYTCRTSFQTGTYDRNYSTNTFRLGFIIYRETSPDVWEYVQTLTMPMPNAIRNEFDGTRIPVLSVDISDNGNRIVTSYTQDRGEQINEEIQNSVYVYDYNVLENTYEMVQQIAPQSINVNWGARVLLDTTGTRAFICNEALPCVPNPRKKFDVTNEDLAGGFNVYTLPAIGSWGTRAISSPLVPQTYDSSSYWINGTTPIVYPTNSHFYSGIVRQGFYSFMSSNAIAYNASSPTEDEIAVSEIAKTSGKWYIEFEYFGTGVASIGIMELRNMSPFPKEITRLASPPDLGDTLRDYTFATTGRKSNSGVAPFTDLGPAVSGQTMAIAVDFDALQIWFALDNVWADSGDPAAGTDPAYTLNSPVAPWVAAASAFTGDNTGKHTTLVMKTTADEFKYAPPAGFNDWSPTPNTNVDAGYPAIVKSESPVSYWKFDNEASGVVSDDIASNDLTLTSIDLGTPGSAPAIVAGVGHNSCVQFVYDANQNSRRAELSAPITIDEQTPFTFTFALWPLDDEGIDSTILSTNSASANQSSVYYNYFTPSNIGIGFRTTADGFPESEIYVTDAIRANAWNHVAILGDGNGNVQVHVNGVLVAEANAWSNFGNGETYDIEWVGDDGLGNSLNGYLDELAYYDKSFKLLDLGLAAPGEDYAVELHMQACCVTMINTRPAFSSGVTTYNNRYASMFRYPL